MVVLFSVVSHLEVSLSPLLIGHTRFTHGHLMAREAPPVCDSFQFRFSIFHTLVECPTYSVPHARYVRLCVRVHMGLCGFMCVYV